MNIDDLSGCRDLIDGRTVFTPGPLVEALKHDCWLVLEEANVMHPGTFSALNTLLDGSGTKYRTKDGRRYSVGNRFRVIMCFNEGAAYAGTREVNAALKDRLAPIYAGYLPANEEIKILIGRTGVDTDTAQRVVDLATQIRAAGKNLGFDLSLRSLMRLLTFKKELLMDWNVAFEASILNLIGDPVEKGPQRSVIRSVADISGMSLWAEPKFS
jgi:MoxR-like ATPase